MSVCFIPPYTPLLYIKTGVYRGVHYFLIFALKHILWVLVEAVLTCTHKVYVLSKKMKIVNKFQLKIVIFTAVKNRCILHGRVFVVLIFSQSIKYCLIAILISTRVQAVKRLNTEKANKPSIVIVIYHFAWLQWRYRPR